MSDPNSPNSMARELGSISTNIEHILTAVNELKGSAETQSGRITALEQFRWRLTGIAGGVSLVFSYIGSKLPAIGG